MNSTTKGFLSIDTWCAMCNTWGCTNKKCCSWVVGYVVTIENFEGEVLALKLFKLLSAFWNFASFEIFGNALCVEMKISKLNNYSTKTLWTYYSLWYHCKMLTKSLSTKHTTSGWIIIKAFA